MATAVKIIEDHNLILVEFHENLGVEEMQQFEQAVAAEVGVEQASLNLLVLIPPMINLTLSSEDLKGFARNERQFAEESKRVIVSSEPLGFGMARMYASNAHEVTDRFRVFRTLDEAAAFLDIPSSEIESRLSFHSP